MRFSTLVILIIIVGVAALVAWKMGYIGEAQKSVEESFNVHLARGKGHYQKTNYEQAIAEIDKAMALEPNHPDTPIALRCKGDCYKELRQPEQAIAMYERILSDYPNFKMRADVEKALMKIKELGYY